MSRTGRILAAGVAMAAVAVGALGQTTAERVALLERDVANMKQERSDNGLSEAVRIGGYGELHADVHKGIYGLRALYSEWTLDGDGPESVGADRQYGWYIEPSIRPIDTVGFFARYSDCLLYTSDAADE